MGGENGAGSQLHHLIGCRTKYCQVQGTTTAHSHSHQAGLRFLGNLRRIEFDERILGRNPGSTLRQSNSRFSRDDWLCPA